MVLKSFTEYIYRPGLLVTSVNLLGQSSFLIIRALRSPKAAVDDGSGRNLLVQIVDDVWMIILGCCLFTVVEWAVHYFVYHGIRFKVRKDGCKIHLQHHNYPEKLKTVTHPVHQQYLWTCLFLGLYCPFLQARTLALVMAGSVLGFWLHEVTHLHAHGHPWLLARVKFLQPARLFHSHHHYSCQKDQVAFGLVSPVLDFTFSTLPAEPSCSPFHMYSKGHRSTLARSVVTSLMRVPVPVPLWHWACMHFLSSDS